MRRSLVVLCFSLTAVSFFSSTVLACGESVFRAGKGVHYRAFTAPIPGTVLVYARTDNERVIAENLQQAGHDVHVVSSDDELATTMAAREFDVVVAPYTLREAVRTSSLQTTSPPDLIPVLEEDSEDLRAAKAEFDDVVTSDEDIRAYLKAIHRSLKAHGA